jgi:hypothetical protein
MHKIHDHVYSSLTGDLNSLGPVVMSCRDQSEKERIEAMGGDMIFYYFMPAVLPLIMFGFLVQALDKLRLKPSQQWGQLILVAFYAIIAGGWFWQLFRRPRKPSLVLHELGFRYKRTVSLFDELVLIRLGRDFTALESTLFSANRLFGLISPKSASAAAFGDRVKEGSVTLVFKTGETKALNGMLIRPHPDDLEKFFQHLNAMHPGLVR